MTNCKGVLEYRDQEFMNVNVIFKEKGKNAIRWDYPTRRELAGIVGSIAEKIKAGAEVEKLEIVKDIKIF